MIDKKMVKALNKQLNAELYASYLYYSASAYLESINFGGFAHWMRAQAMEEIGHAQRFYNHIVERGGDVKLEKIEQPQKKWKSLLETVKAAYDHEVKVTGMINKLVDLAQKEKDHATFNFLQWFVMEQVEEEEQTSELIAKLEMIGDSVGSILMYDKKMGERPIKAFWQAPK